MKLFLPIIGLLLIASCATEEPEETENKKQFMLESEIAFDSKLAKKINADKFGMKTYVMAILKKGPNRDQDSAEAAALQRAHLDNIFRLSDQNKLIIAGPFMDDTELSGIYIFNVETVEEARKLTETDPAVKAGRLIMELHPWYGPAGLMVLDSIQKKITLKEN